MLNLKSLRLKLRLFRLFVLFLTCTRWWS